MRIRYSPPSKEPKECSFLEANYLTCLKEKQLKDEIPIRECSNENILWYYLECPKQAALFNDNNYMRKAFIESKQTQLSAAGEEDEGFDDD